MKSLLDTNFIINLLFEEQPYHNLAIKTWKELDEAYISSVIIFELSYFL